MSDLQNLIKEWQQVAGGSTINDKSFLNLNNKIMDSIINYENAERKEKKAATRGLFIGVLMILFTLGWQYYDGDIALTPLNFIGFAIMFGAALKAIYSNRTDDFPDARILATKEYLTKVKEDISSRRKRHFTNTFLALSIYIPAMFLAFYNIYVKEEVGDTLNILLICALAIGSVFIIVKAVKWFKQYDERTLPLKQELSDLIEEIE